MAEIKSAQKDARNSARATVETVNGFTKEEKAAMRERVQELKTAAHRGHNTARADGESEVLAKLASLPESDRALGERIHAIVKATASADSETLVRHARLRQRRRQCRVLLPGCAKIQNTICDAWIQ
jgi:hypothetical protein